MAKLDEYNQTDDQAQSLGRQVAIPAMSPYAKPGPYQTTLSPSEELMFRAWIATKRVPFDPGNPYSDYDMRGFWQAQRGGDPNAQQSLNRNDQQMHFPDTYKTPYHKSFSNESRWAAPGAPHWNDLDQLVDDKGNVVYDERAPKK